MFLFIFLPAVLLLYYICPGRFRNWVLFFVNIVFYAWGEPKYILVMLFATLSGWLHGLMIDRCADKPRAKKFWLISACAVSLLLLGYFKYAAFLLETIKSIPAFSWIDVPKIVLPIGISFYTFQIMSYFIDVYRGKVTAQKNFINFACYVTLFPQLIAGPIVRYSDIAEQLTSRRESIECFAAGVKIFVIGLSKKLLLANPMGALWEELRATPSQNGTFGCFMGMVAFTLQIYFDFDGYSDMATGLGRMFGFEFPANFNYPYISGTITEFWRRWHISLSSWFREYVYIPLGGNRKGLRRQILNLLIVWFLTGLWHGASMNFIVWGLYFGLILIIEKLFLLKFLQKAPGFVGHIYSLAVIIFGFLIFSTDDLPEAGRYFISVFSNSAGFASHDALSLILNYLPLMAVGVVAATPLGHNIYDKIKTKRYAFIPELAGCAVLLFICTANMVGSGYNPFLYFRF